MTTSIAAVDGLGGAGKSTLADRLAAKLGGSVIHTDDFASWNVPLDWWPRMLEEVFRPLAANLPARFQRFDWDLGVLGERQSIDPGGVVIVEGVSASRAAFRPYLACSIWVETPRSERLRRGLERDGLDAFDQWARWMAAEDAWVAAESPRDWADIVIPGL